MLRTIFNTTFGWYLRQRLRTLDAVAARPVETQRRWLMKLIQRAESTEFGRAHGFVDIESPERFAKRVRVQDYESLKPQIERMMRGEEDILWRGRVKYFSKSSGTTSDRSKYLPVSDENLRDCHIRGTWDTMSFFYDQVPNARQFAGKSLLMGGNLEQYQDRPGTITGDISAIMIDNMPGVARPFFTPDFETALLSNFEEKLARMVEIVSREKDLAMIGGVPTWTVVFFRKILEHTGAAHLLEVFPNLQGYIHGGVSFTPYREQFRRFLPDENFAYQEIYNASEGYFAAQSDFSNPDGGMRLLLDNGVYYEFLPMDQWDAEFPVALTLDQVQIGVDYALLITTNAGLWRYRIGDTIEFTSLDPHTIRVTGRTKQFINAFGEEVMVHNTDQALHVACEQMGCAVSDYTVAPIYFQRGERGGHEWLVEFEQPPAEPERFADLLDEELQRINSDYAAKRTADLALERLQLRVLPPGSFNRWLKQKGKLGGQHKVPRLANERKYVEEILAVVHNDLGSGNR